MWAGLRDLVQNAQSPGLFPRPRNIEGRTNKGEAGKLGKNENQKNKTWYLHVA